MPYIKQERRKQFELGEAFPNDAGELNYAITLMIKGYLGKKGLSYSNLNEVIGALECAKMELYRRVAVPYEDKKIKENGDVY